MQNSERYLGTASCESENSSVIRKAAETCKGVVPALLCVIGIVFGSDAVLAQNSSPNPSAREVELLKKLTTAQTKGPFRYLYSIRILNAFYQQDKQWAKVAQHSQELVALWRNKVGVDSVGAARVRS
jgi:hypothetical protein